MNFWRGLRGAFSPPPVLMALVGAGGKSTILTRLAQEAAAAGHRVVVTTTTHLWIRQFAAFPRTALVASRADAIAKARQTAPGEILALAREVRAAEARVAGLPPSWVDALREHADVVLVEADGARERPLKAPASHEPAVPERTTHLVVVAGWHGIYKPLDAVWVHRPERFAQLSGLSLGAPITPAALVRVLRHPEGGLKHRPPHAHVSVVLNQMDRETHLRLARRMANDLLRTAAVSEVILASARAQDPIWEVHGRVAAVLLAAGEGKRFGGAKQVALWRGKPLIVHVLDALAQTPLAKIVVVVGAHANRVRPVVEAWARQHPHVPLNIVDNPRWAEGQSTSVRAGLAALGPVSAAIFPLADQPRITPDLIHALIQAHRRTLAAAVVPRYGGRPGAPVLFDRRVFRQLAALQGDTGGRALLHAYASDLVHVDWADATAGWDVDRPEDLKG